MGTILRIGCALATWLAVCHVTYGVDMLHQLPSAAGLHVPPSECRSLVDLYIVVDGSDSISAADFTTLKHAIASLIPQVHLGINRARAGMLVYSSHVPVESEHPFSADPNYLATAATTLVHPRDGTNTALGIDHMTAMFRQYGRTDVPWVAVVITDGISKDPGETAAAAALAEGLGISMFAVGVGHRIDRTELAAIASTPRQVLLLDRFDQLRDILATMMTTICPCPAPPLFELADSAQGPRAIGSVRTYTCKHGYLQQGNPQIVCQDDSTWSLIQFQCVPCGETPVLQYATCGGDRFTIGSKRRFTCDAGYAGFGNPEISCLQDATWSIPDFRCSPCSTTPLIDHGSCGDGKYTVGSRQVYTCDAGYAAFGNPEIVCQPDATWSQPMFTCSPCFSTPIIEHGSCGAGDYTLGSRRMFTCDAGYAGFGNPEIQCLPDATWTLPDFRCSPCMDTPVIKYGICGRGDHTIGSRRMYTCDAGYAGFGNPEIQCLPDATWTLPDFRCFPCMDTPLIQHGICGRGDHTIGSRRMYKCDAGYAGFGNPEIQCLPDATWTLPDFRCSPCMDTPLIKYGICGRGDHTIGSRRMYTCDAGYAGFGNPEIQCLPDATWTLPDFRCSPCMDTPVLKYGICGRGDHTIGSRRMYTCDAGYAGFGNPEIQCLPDATWTLPDFRCSPCMDTPLIQHGICGRGDHTIGSRRMYTCDAGYAGFGNPEIQCLPDATWTLPDFRCSPCMDTPLIQHGICGRGDHTIGSRRMYKCDAGYAGFGNPEIQCLPDATWTLPDFRCSPCMDTPLIKYAICGRGDHTIGSRRMYTCDAGYAGFGNPEIQCLPDATWTLPDFRCSPCMDTPVLKYGICGRGDHTIGSRRMYTCDAGYAGFGNPEIQCLPDATWTLPDFRCSPCMDTPLIKYGICGRGDHTIGSRRMYTCDAGYAGFGNPEIQCLPDATWTLPDFRCSPCMDTPVLKYGICGRGDHTIGSRRMYTCDAGYAGFGNPEIQCLPDATWTLPDFRCTPCMDTPVIKYGISDRGDHTIGSRRMYTCDAGYAGFGNPEIQCLLDATWTLPDFRCSPCMDTPVIKYGICGRGDHTIGSRRMYTCDAGYAGFGNPEIQCLPDATWTLPDFRCSPCMDTPLIKYGICGRGDHTIGSRRMYTCDAGYAGFGNPEIQCLPDAAWTLPDFRCSPCMDTPLIQHGICGGGDYTIGSRRMYTCDPGYAALGNPEIKCLPNAMWTLPDFSCSPCREPPSVAHGVCGAGDHTIGSRRIFSCQPGYAAIGNPEVVCLPDTTWSIPEFTCSPCATPPAIVNGFCGAGDSLVGSRRMLTCAEGFLERGYPYVECLPSGQWSHPTFECTDCGAPPMVANAYTRLGHSLIGSQREYFCEDGYHLFGNGRITCLGNGHWDAPNFNCMVRTTTTPSPPQPIPDNPSVCDSCRYINGVGYMPHPFDCNQYVQCFVGNKGLQPAYRKCPFGQFWDQNVLTCRPSQQVFCEHDKCRTDRTLHGYKHTDQNRCCSYWKCDGGKSYGECCGEGRSYNPTVGTCMENTDCWEDTCLYEQTLPGCDKVPGVTETGFRQHIGNGIFVDMPCAPGTAFNPADCECSLTLLTVPGNTRQQVCKPELYLPFNDDLSDRSGKNVYVRNENVSIINGAAFFNGQSRLMIPRFSNTEFSGDLVIKLRYREILDGATAASLQALVTNGDCGSDPSIVIAKMPGYVLLGSRTDEPRSFAIPTVNKPWKEVIYMHNEQRLEGRVCGAAMSQWSWGPIQATHCALQVGHGQGLAGYTGLIDDLYIYQCRPRASVLTLY